MCICNLVFGLEILMPGIFLGLKFQAYVFFWVCNMKHRQTPCHVHFEYPPLFPPLPCLKHSSGSKNVGSGDIDLLLNDTYIHLVVTHWSVFNHTFNLYGLPTCLAGVHNYPPVKIKQTDRQVITSHAIDTTDMYFHICFYMLY